METADGVVSGSGVVKWGWKPGSVGVMAIMVIRRTTVDGVEERITLKGIFVARGGVTRHDQTSTTRSHRKNKVLGIKVPKTVNVPGIAGHHDGWLGAE